MKRLVAAAVTAILLTPLAARAEPQLERVRGTVESADGGTVKIKTDEGTKSVALAGAAYVWVVKSSLDQIKDGVFIGTATKGDNPPTALEVVLFPDSMRGTGEGHYAWDAINDQTSGGAATKSAMTNGTVKATSGGAPKVKSAMTNGTVKASSGQGQKTLTVTYEKDGSKEIVVPPNAPIVAFEPADQKILQPGGKIFVVATKDGDALKGKLVAVGKDGLTPPM